MIFVSNNLIESVSGYNTNSNNDGNGLENSDLDLEWVNKMSDHFLVVWNINQDIKDDTIINETWRLNSENWEQYRHLLESLLHCVTEQNVENGEINESKISYNGSKI